MDLAVRARATSASLQTLSQCFRNCFEYKSKPCCMPCCASVMVVRMTSTVSFEASSFAWMSCNASCTFSSCSFKRLEMIDRASSSLVWIGIQISSSWHVAFAKIGAISFTDKDGIGHPSAPFSKRSLKTTRTRSSRTSSPVQRTGSDALGNVP